MARGGYNYDKSVLAELGIGDFLNEVKVREAHIAAAPDVAPQADYNVNAVAAQLHPNIQFCVVAQVEDLGACRVYTLRPDNDFGCFELATFRAGQFVSVAHTIDGKPTTRCYHICSSPKDALGPDSFYQLMVYGRPGAAGGTWRWVFENWQVGTKIMMSGPLGRFFYQDLRDARHVVGLSMSGAFYAMARAIADGVEDFRLTAVSFAFGDKHPALKALERELEERAQGKVRFVNVVCPPPAGAGFANPLTAELLASCAAAGAAGGAGGTDASSADATVAAGAATDSDFSIFSDLPSMFAPSLEQATRELGLPRRRMRKEFSCDFTPAGAPRGATPRGAAPQDNATPQNNATPAAKIAPQAAESVSETSFMVKAHVRSRIIELPCRASETLLAAMEAAGISVPADCRSGSCGWCRSRLIAGEIHMPEGHDERREADRKFGWIHPCVSFPRSDIELEVFPFMGLD